ncbi:PAS domain-containing protein [Candidatus Parcubacteria bacterium]|nr:MAG: PAS domain-containing protein [Candidatus Parcubacteria bacterium]
MESSNRETSSNPVSIVPKRGLRIFWFSLPLLLGAFLIGLVYLEPLFVFIQGAFLALVAFAVFFAAKETARLGQAGTVEHNELRGIIYGLDDALVAYDQDFKVLFFNPAAERLFHLKADTVLEDKLQARDVERPERKLLAQVIFPSLAPGMVTRSQVGAYPQIVDLSFTDPALELRVVTAPVDDGKGGILGFMKIIRNRTREVLLVKSKNEFLTVASHQLRGPLTNINWALQTLLGDKAMSEGSVEIVKNAATASQALLGIIEDLLNITRIEEGHFGYSFKQTDLIEFVEKILGEASPQARRATVKLYFDRPKEPLPKLMLDSQKLSLVFNNLLDNAIRYNVPNGEIIVKAERMKDQPFVVVSVKDTGIGVPPEGIGKIFTKFFRADNALKFQTEGSGLGLYIAKNIVQAHGGQMWAESEVNRGSTFFLTLPTDPTLIPPHEVVIE